MAQDISLLGAVYSDVPSVLLPKQGGGTAQFDDTTDADATASDILSGKTAYVNGVKITGTGTGGGGSVTQDQDGFIVLPTTGGGGGGGNWTWMGNNATLVRTPYSNKIYLEDTAFDTWTPTTSQTSLGDLPSGFTYSCTADDGKDYVAILRWHTHFVYEPNTEEKAIITDAYGSFGAVLYSYCTNLATITSDGFNAHYSVSTQMSTGVFCKSTSGSDVFTTSNYGVYLTAPSCSGNSTSFTLSDAPLYARCSSSYFSTASASLVDKSASYIEAEIKLYSVDGASSFFGGIREEIRNMYKNGL